MASSFKDQMGAIGHLEECSEYLHARGLDFKELPIVTSLAQDVGLFTRTEGEYFKYELNGWAFRIKDKWGEVLDGCFLMRPVWDEAELYQRKDKQYELVEKKPKFRQVGKWTINWVSTAAECKASSTLMIHEKFTCAYLSVKHLGVPSIGLSGCHNWRRGGGIDPDLRDVLINMPPNATVYMCLDGDVLTNEGIHASASAFKGYMESLRPDITVIFPLVPEGYGGWDDWAVDQEDIQGTWILELNAQRIDITGFLTKDLLINQYGLAYKTDKDGVPHVLHTVSNYIKLFTGHPKWADYVMNIDDMMYDKNNPGAPLEFEDVARKLEIWLTESAFNGAAAERVSNPCCSRAVKDSLSRPDRQLSLPHYHIDIMGGPPGLEAARAAAERLVTEGIKVVAPMTHEENVETILRVFRDMVGMWSYDRLFCPQWMFALVGPSNAGKSDFPRSVLRPLLRRGFFNTVGRLHYMGDKAKPEEMSRVLKSVLAGVVDEYNPPSHIAKTFEDQLLSISSDRTIAIRRMRENNAKEMLRPSSLFLTTTDRNRQYLRSGGAEGAERRAITFEVVPFHDYEGKLSSNRAVIEECSEVLLRWGLEAYRAGYGGSATEFSRQYAHQYIEEDNTLGNVGKMWAKGDLAGCLERYGKIFYRPSTEDWRLSPTQLYEMLYPGERLQRDQRLKLQNLAVDCGAAKEGKGRVNHMSVEGGQTIVDSFLRIENWEEWSIALGAALGA